MLMVGITGGIGSGKTTVCKVFEVLGIPVFYADVAARRLMETDASLMRGIIALLGSESYRDGKLNRPFVASSIFGNPDLLRKMNALTHPAVIAHGKEWMSRQQAPYALKEAALFFEAGSAGDMDVMIGVTAPLEIRIARTIRRDGISRAHVLERMSRQMDEAEKMKRCDFVIHNDETQAVIPQVLAVHRALLARI
jgi:dephospho-CoA kinase